MTLGNGWGGARPGTGGARVRIKADIEALLCVLRAAGGKVTGRELGLLWNKVSPIRRRYVIRVAVGEKRLTRAGRYIILAV